MESSGVTMNRIYLPVAHSASRLSVLILILISFLRADSAHAHPVPRRAHDRTIVVRLQPDKVIVEYRLEVDEFTVVYDDLPAFSDQIDLTRLTKPDEFYDPFTRCYAPVLAGNLNQETAVADECDSKFSFTRQLGLIGAARSWSHR